MITRLDCNLFISFMSLLGSCVVTPWVVGNAVVLSVVITLVVNGVVVGSGVVVVSCFMLSLHRLSLQQPPAKPDPLFPKVFVETEDIWPQSYRIQIKRGSYKLKIVNANFDTPPGNFFQDPCVIYIQIVFYYLLLDEGYTKVLSLNCFNPVFTRKKLNLVITWSNLLRRHSRTIGFEHVTNQIHILVELYTWRPCACEVQFQS